MRLGLLTVSHELLAAALRLPEGTRILRTRDGVLVGALEIQLEHPALPDTPEAHPIPRVDLEYTALTENGAASITASPFLVRP